MSIEKAVWFYKHRPRSLDDLILEPKLRKEFESYVQKKDIPHLLFCGRQGTGKTALAEIIISALDPDDVATMRLNASDESGIDTLRSKIITFCKISSPNPLKIIFLDECDGLKSSFQEGMRGVLDKYIAKTRFIMTCNYVSNVIDPVLSRFTQYDFQLLPKKQVVKQMMAILKSENIEFETPDVFTLVEDYYPDIRSIVNILQRFSRTGVFAYTDDDSKASLYQRIADLIKEGAYKELFEFVYQNPLDWTDAYVHLFEKMDKLFGEQASPGLCLVVFEAMKDHTLVIDPFVNFMAFSVKAMRSCGIPDGKIN